MTEHDPSERDELIAAYLDGEATEAERADVEADTELMARLEIMRRVAELVGEPVLPPPLEVRSSHIAAALAASATAPNVTALAPRRRRWSSDYTAVLGAAAVILVVLLAVPILLLTASDDDDDSVATSVTEELAADEPAREPAIANTEPERDGDSEAAFDAAGEAEAVEEEPAEEPAEAAAEEPADEPAEAAAEEPADEPAEAAAEAPADEALADDGSTETGSTLLDADAAALLTGNLPDIDALIDQVEIELGNDATAQRTLFDLGLSLQCEGALGELALDAQLVLVGSSTIDDQTVEYVVVQSPAGIDLIVVDGSNCETLATEALDNG